MSKRTAEDSEIDRDKVSSHHAVLCQEAPCVLKEIPLELYHEHAMQYHEHRCEACLRNFVTERLLELHLEEFHNPFASKSVLKCFEPGCNKQFCTHSQRVRHLRDDHNYPETFNFDIIQEGYIFQ